ncbi:UDP-glucose 4-epimerase GalE [Moorena sp. SIO3H5]|uniref:UDP-glucose 4-epimerase GalE n=1 Tax=Moorena sp. SIO3H5 TaxID=2607834 RepID=UPI0013B791BE|nr:UDP-glucose 4-epimerase GalE [Moorena sp. SIO3H5]NEO68916.1 UDP-glucose 4-epimerase GalE [Moorena sp. SIO3H5]
MVAKQINLNILVTGGAGYIGSHAVLALIEAGYQVTVLDNLSKGFADAVLPPARLIQGDLSDQGLLDDIFQQEKFQAVMHFAASSVVPESVQYPLTYYSNNVTNTINLLKVVKKYKVPNFIFSSSASVYGIPDVVPVTETMPLSPISPYGRTKLISEWMIQDLAKAEPWFRYGILRYFNVAGSDPEGRLGQNTPNATHLIKLACQTALGHRSKLQIFGDDYPTTDGTGVRDFIHVTDLANAHLIVLKHLAEGTESNIYNCGYGKGYSVREVVNTVKEISKVDFPVEVTHRRTGDSPEVVADVTKILQHTEWHPKFDSLQVIVEHAFQWEKSRLSNMIDNQR